jgi:hypothetical protein
MHYLLTIGSDLHPIRWHPPRSLCYDLATPEKKGYMMPAFFDSLPFEVAAVLFVSIVYGYWMWSRFRAGRLDALFSSGLIICFQLLSTASTDNPGLALVATIYHAALVGAIYTAAKGVSRAPAR